MSVAPFSVSRCFLLAVIWALLANALPVQAQRALGIDVYSGQGNLNWTNIRTSGVSFAWAKATEGLTFTDSTFVKNQTNARAAGVLIGAYHFAHPETHLGLTGADQEAAHFWSVSSKYITNGSVYLMPMLDIESALTNKVSPYTTATLSQWVNEWCYDIVRYAATNGVTVTPVIYTYTSYSTAWLDSTVTNWPLWMASYPSSPNPQTGAPSTTTPWSNWYVWQFDDTNTMLNGTPRNCDVDVYYSSTNALGPIVIGGYGPPNFFAQPINDRVTDAGGSVTFSAAAGGSPKVHYQWSLNGTNLLYATNTILTLTNAQPTNSGNYTLVVTNTSGSITSSPTFLLVYPLQTTVFADNFDANTAPNWIVNKSSADTAIAFNYDYSALGIPSAPHSTGSTTRGVQMKANLTSTSVAALSISPTNQSFSGDYRLHFDAWINVNGPLPGGGASSTEFLTAGVGTAGNRTEWNGAGATADGFYFSADGDGGINSATTTTGDYAGYKGTAFQNIASGIYAAGAIDHGNGYYTTAFSNSPAAPALQQSTYPQQTGNLNIGAFGLAWHDVIVSKRGNVVNWSADGILLATITNVTFTASNVCVGFWDPFSSLTDNTNLSFGLVDNVRVEVPATAPIITTNPQPQTVVLGTNVLFTAAASGLPVPNYQWQFNGAPISGATNTSFTITNVSTANVGNYSVTATNIVGTATSAPAALQLQAPTAAQFQSITVQSDGSVQISFTGDAVWTYTIETSTDLTTWNALTNLTSANGMFNFTAGSTTNAPQQFYRARVGP